MSHCRFEAKAVFGIEQVIVADFDEFLYCPMIKSGASSQRAGLAALFEQFTTAGFDQMSLFTQSTMLNKTVEPWNCVVNKSQAGLSTFECFGSTEFYAFDHSV